MREAFERDAAAKAKLAQRQSDLDQQRELRRRTFQRARIAEVKLPTVIGDARPTDGGSDKKPKRKRSSTTDAEPEGPSTSAFLSSESFSPSELVGTETLEGVDGEQSAEAGPSTSQASASAEAAVELIRIDFSSLSEDLRRQQPSQFEKYFGEQVTDISKDIDGMAPNMKAIEQYDDVLERLHAMDAECDTTRNAHKTLQQQFKEVHTERLRRFKTCIDSISESIEEIYADLTNVEGVPGGGAAYLACEDHEFPFLHGIKYSAQPAGKRYRDMEELSGGERTVAALALLFAIHKFRPSPFFVMDEVDAALDNVNVTRVAQYIRERAADGTLQFVVISLKDQFYHMAHGLVGVYRDRKEECSAIATLDLERLERRESTAQAAH